MIKILPFKFWMLLLLACGSGLFSIQAQHYETYITKVVDEQGISPGATFAILEDSIGFIWFGTTDGLYRYDGYNLKVFRNIPGNDNSLSNNTVRGLALDHEGKLWIATQGGGLDCLDIYTEKFTHYKHTAHSSNEISGNSLWSVMVDHADNIWIGVTGKGIDRLDKSDMTFRHYMPLKVGNSLRQEQTIRKLAEGPNGNIWAGIPDHGVISLNPETGYVSIINEDSQHVSGLSDAIVYDILFDREDKLWICTYGGGINVYDTKTGKMSYSGQRESGITSDLIYSIAINQNELWIGTEYGLNRLDPEMRVIETYQKGEGSNFSLSEDRIRKIYIDSKGIIWIGGESGVDKMVLGKYFRVYRNQGNNPNSLPKGIVRTIQEDKEGNLWIGLVENGLVKYSRESGIYKHFLNDPLDPYSLPGNNINAIFEDSKGHIWIGEWNVGLIRYEPATGRFYNEANAWGVEGGLVDNRIQVIREDQSGRIWIGTENGISRYNPDNQTFTNYQHTEYNPNSISGNAIQSQAFLFDRENNLWAGTWSFGLNRIEFLDSDEQVYHVSKWQHDPNDSSSLNNNNVISLLKDGNTIWIGTFGGGLSRLDLKSNTIKAYTTENGLPNNIIFAIIKDKRGWLWLSTDNGLALFNPETETFRNFTQSDGLQGNHFFWGAAYQAQNDEVFFGGINGLNSFFPEQIKTDTTPAKPVMVEIRIFNQVVQFEESLMLMDQVEFGHEENSLTFEFAALDFQKPEQNQYKFMLEGFDKEWMMPSNRHQVSYTNLPPGRYLFRLMVSNHHGVWNEDMYELRLIIRHPWWRTWWMISLFVILLVSLTYIIIDIRFRILRRQKENLEKEVIYRTSEIRKQNVRLEQQTLEIQNQYSQLNQQKKELTRKNKALKQTLNKLEKTQRALVDSEKMASLGILTAGVAHEINNPLNFIAVSVDNIKAELESIDLSKLHADDSENLKLISNMLKHAEMGVDRILRITKKLNTFAHKGEEESEVFDVRELIDISLKILSPKMPAGIQVEKKLDDIPMISGQKYQLSQVFINIVDNALDAIKERGIETGDKISIVSKSVSLQKTRFVSLTISNTGPPISDKVIKNIFDPFFTTKDPNRGTGLGLYLSYNIIKEHNGFFSVENSDNKVIFNVKLPVYQK